MDQRQFILALTFIVALAAILMRPDSIHSMFLIGAIFGIGLLIGVPDALGMPGWRPERFESPVWPLMPITTPVTDQRAPPYGAWAVPSPLPIVEEGSPLPVGGRSPLPIVEGGPLPIVEGGPMFGAGNAAGPRAAPKYPGSIDAGDFDSEAPFGHSDQRADDVPPYGTPFNTSRVAFPAKAGGCVDDEANDAEIDGDEGGVYQALSRNDATRATAGSMNRRRDLDPYFREEVEEAENRMWWGQGEL
jgi:hypothetical protein